MKSTKKVTTIDEYIKLYPKEVAVRLKTMRDMVRKAAPAAAEKISYGMPAFKLNGILIYFAAHEHHIGIYPYPKTLLAFQKELSKYATGKSTIQIKHNEKFPTALIRKVIQFRVKDNLAKSKKK